MKILIVDDGANTEDLVRMVCKDLPDMADNDIMMMPCKDLNGVVPEKIQVIPGGFHKTAKGDFLHDAESQRMVVANAQAQVNDMVVDFEHQTLLGTEAPAAGWINRKTIAAQGDEGTWANVDWTPRASQRITNKEYRYVSPVFLIRKSDRRVVALLNVALTNQPNIDGMVPLINKAVGAQPAVNSKEETNMELMQWLIALLKLPSTATMDEVKAALQAELSDDGPVANKAVLTALGLADTATESEVTGTIMAMKQSHTQQADLSGKVTELQNKLSLRDATEAVDLAVNSGKITPAQKDWAIDYAKRDLPGFQVFVAKAPVVVHTGKVVTDAGGAGGAQVPDENLQLVCKQFGTDPKEILKASQASAT